MKKRILIVEDESNIVISLKFLFEQAGFDVADETDGTKALSRILNDAPDVLILDVMLPGLDGFEILRRIRADSEINQLPVLMLTAKGQRQDRKNALDQGADLFITKPFSNSEVVKAVEFLAHGNRS